MRIFSASHANTPMWKPFYFAGAPAITRLNLTDRQRDVISLQVREEMLALASERKKQGEKPFDVQVWRYSPASSNAQMTMIMSPPKSERDKNDLIALLEESLKPLLQAAYQQYGEVAREPRLLFRFEDRRQFEKTGREGCCFLRRLFLKGEETAKQECGKRQSTENPGEPHSDLCGGCTSLVPKGFHPRSETLKPVNLFA